MIINLSDFQTAWKYWQKDRAGMMAAALAYYGIFALGPTLLLVISGVGLVLGDTTARDSLLLRLQPALGGENTRLIASILDNLQAREQQGVIAILGYAGLGVAVLGFFGHIKESLDIIWKQNKHRKIWWDFGWGYIQSIAVALLLGGIWIGLVIATNIVNLLAEIFALPNWVTLINYGLLFPATVIFLALLIKFLVRRKLDWLKLFAGSLVTTTLLALGVGLFRWYLSIAGLGGTFGAAGSLVALLVFAYYAAQIFFFGVELIRSMHGG